MKFLSTRELRNRPGVIREILKGGDVALTANGKPFAIVIALNGLYEMLALTQAVELLRRDEDAGGFAVLGDHDGALIFAQPAQDARRVRLELADGKDVF